MDLICIGIVLAFFLLSLGFIRLCRRLGGET